MNTNEVVRIRCSNIYHVPESSRWKYCIWNETIVEQVASQQVEIGVRVQDHQVTGGSSCSSSWEQRSRYW